MGRIKWDSTSNRIEWIRMASDIMAVTAIANCVHIYVSDELFSVSIRPSASCFEAFALSGTLEAKHRSQPHTDNNAIRNETNGKNIEKIVSKDNGSNIILWPFFLCAAFCARLLGVWCAVASIMQFGTGSS